MKPPTKIAIVGCGGIGCQIIPVLSRMFPLVLIDEDQYEVANSSRQFPALTQDGNKAEILARMTQEHTLHKIEFIPEFVKDAMITNHPEWKGVNFIVSGVDNNASRHIIAQLAEDLEIPCILAGNSHEHGEAHLLIPGTYHPMDHYDFGDDGEKPPWSCNSDKVLEEFSQTPFANFLAAGCAIHLLLSWQRVTNPLNCVVYSRTDALCSSYSRVKDLLQAADERLTAV